MAEVTRELPSSPGPGHVQRADYDALTAELTTQTGVTCLGLWSVEGQRLDGSPDPTVNATHIVFGTAVDEQIVDDVIANWPPAP